MWTDLKRYLGGGKCRNKKIFLCFFQISPFKTNQHFYLKYSFLTIPETQSWKIKPSLADINKFPSKGLWNCFSRFWGANFPNLFPFPLDVSIMDTWVTLYFDIQWYLLYLLLNNFCKLVKINVIYLIQLVGLNIFSVKYFQYG